MAICPGLSTAPVCLPQSLGVPVDRILSLVSFLSRVEFGLEGIGINSALTIL